MRLLKIVSCEDVKKKCRHKRKLPKIYRNQKKKDMSSWNPTPFLLEIERLNGSVEKPKDYKAKLKDAQEKAREERHLKKQIRDKKIEERNAKRERNREEKRERHESLLKQHEVHRKLLEENGLKEREGKE